MRLLLIAVAAVLVISCAKEKEKIVYTAKNLHAYDGNNTNIGLVALSDWPKLTLVLSDSATLGISGSTGNFGGGLCSGGYCTSSSFETLYYKDTLWQTRLYNPSAMSYCHFQSTDCSGTCLLIDKPMKNSVFKSPAGYFKATGSETGSSLVIKSFYRIDYADCGVVTSTVATSTNFGYSATAYSVDTSYTLPSEITIPVPTPITLAP